MLDEFLRTLSDEAQLRIALRLCRAATPIWTGHLKEHPQDLEKLNSLIGKENRVEGGAQHIDIDFLSRALQKVERSYEQAHSTGKKAVPVMKSDPLLQPMLATSMQPLTNPRWDDTLPRSVRLVFTSIWNLLTWILFKRATDARETHVSLAINQAADALMSESLMTVEQINELLAGYGAHQRAEGEDAEWECAPTPSSGGANQGTPIDDVFRQIAGERVVKDRLQEAQVREALRQMREEGRSFWDEWEEYYHGTSNTYSYNKEKGSYWRTEVDVVVGSFCNEVPMSEEDMADFISGKSPQELRQSGFEI